MTDKCENYSHYLLAITAADVVPRGGPTKSPHHPLCRKYTQQKSSTTKGFLINSVLTRNGCIECYTISLFREIILQQLNGFKGSLHFKRLGLQNDR